MPTTQPRTVATAFIVGTIVDTGPGDFCWTFDVVHRTHKFVTLRQHGNPDHGAFRVGIKVSDRSGKPSEWALPFGSFSQAPVIRPGQAEV